MKLSKHRISYFYDEDIGNFYYSERHPMKPIRVRMTHSLVLAYGLHEHLQVFRPKRADFGDMITFHNPDYVYALEKASRNISAISEKDKKRYNLGTADCPMFKNIYEFSQISAGGTISAAQRINYNLSDISINWAGGLHHATKSCSSGFCYIADCVLGIIELLKYNPRVMYIDIDIHHGDGVEQAFYDSNRVLTCSFHKFSRHFFPGTGHVYDIGIENGKYYSVNVPLRDGITDETYLNIFKPVIKHLVDWFRPTAIMLQCGADSLVGDKLGRFNLSTYGHGECVEYVKSFNIPLVITGGGGYTKESVAKCWCYETALITGQEIANELPETHFHYYYTKNNRQPLLHLEKDPDMENYNSESYINMVLRIVTENSRNLPNSPSVQLQELPDREEYFEQVTNRQEPLYASLAKKLGLDRSMNEY